MELKSKLFAILAIFCVICSACAVSATDNISYHGAYDDIRDAHNDLIISPDANHDETAQAAGGDDFDNGIPNHGDGTDPASDDNVDNGVPFHADGTDPAEAADYVMGNSTSHVAAGNTNTTNTTNATNTMPATGNPILLLLGVCALVGGYTVIRRK